ncbi:MAG: AP2 domain-containing protein [Roseiflexaceae bacterium]|nr:AP2 domain-containing protein [Roseiflexaceae bacterium]
MTARSIKSRTTKHKNITRVDQPSKNTHGYNVRIQWKGQLYTKFFSDNVCGDRLSALHDAIEWRDSTEKVIGKPHTSRQVVGLSARNKTGVIGVRRRKRGSTEVYEATWITDEGKVGRTTYSIARHGERKAFKLAVKARTEHEAKRQLTPIEEVHANRTMRPREVNLITAPQPVTLAPLTPALAPEWGDMPDWPELEQIRQRKSASA